MPCRIIHDENGNPIGHALIRRKSAGPCKFCRARQISLLCDFPVGKGKTCDAGMCDRCATQIKLDIQPGTVGLVDSVDYCPRHKGQTPPQQELFAA